MSPPMSPRQTLSIDELKDRLLAQIEALVPQLAPPATGSFRKGDLYYTLNPGRADRSVGSFVVHMGGPKAGQWCDYAVPGREGRGDIIDLFGLALGLSTPAARIKEARRWLGLDTEDPATRRARQDHAARMKAERARRAEEDKARAEKRKGIAKAIFLSAQERILGTPVDSYLAGRGIDLRALPHLSGAIRFHPECRYYHDIEETDPETGEVRRRSTYRTMPAMVTALARGPEIVDCHRTYLERQPDGRWTKAALPDTKKVLTDYSGASARLCGETGPRGGQLKLRQAPPGSTVWITEGIENGLSLIAIRALTGKPPAFVIAAGAVFNFSRVELPETIGTVVLAADNDTGEQARAALDLAVLAHKDKGRTVRVWRSKVPGEDLNDALKRALKEQQERGAA